MHKCKCCLSCFRFAIKTKTKIVNMGAYKTKFYFLKNNTLLLILLFLVNFILKTYKIEKGNTVVWDEAHFGKFGARYLKREFYFDVHPPLGKMMTALSGYIFGQEKDFKFDSGSEYPSTMDYVGMRRFHAFFSSFLPLFVYGIFDELGFRNYYSLLMSVIYIFENGFCSISRLILLDSHLMFFTGSTAYLITRLFCRRRKLKDEILNLLFLGISIGCVMSVKWIGCLTTLLVGLFIIHELWHQLMSKRPLRIFIYKFLLRTIFLIVLPIILYMFWFLIHFLLCKKSTSDEAHMSSLFQASLVNNEKSRNRKYTIYGSVISIKSSKLTGGNLHSHESLYPDSNYKQITTYFHKDENNHWAFQKVIDGKEEAVYVCDRDELVIYHISTKSYLSGDTKKAYRSEGTRVIGISETIIHSCIWIIEIVNDEIKLEQKVKTITTKFRLKNKETGGYLNWSGKNYPQWGFQQGEVTCINNPGSGTLWNVEENKMIENDLYEEYTEIQKFRTNFIKHLIEINMAMFNSNKSLVQEINLEPARIISRPYEWFILRRGLRMNSWDDDRYKFYMFGNPIIWYISSISVLLSPFILFCKFIFKKRNGSHISKKEFFIVYISFGGWMIHYLPFFFISRVLYFHHYFPALFFAMLSIGYVFNHLPKRFLELMVITSVIVYFYFSTLTYGIIGPAMKIENKKWLKSWDFT